MDQENKSNSQKEKLDVLVDVERYKTPFSYFFAQKAFNSNISTSLLSWLENDAPWRLHTSSFFEQYECNVLNSDLPENCAILCKPEMLGAIRSRIERLLETELTEKVTVTAHKMIAGQGIGIHNDNPHDELETHRLIVPLNHGFKDHYGGHLIFFNSNDTSDISKAFRPIHNTAIGVTLSNKSYHAVADIHEGIRYTVIFSFWEREKPIENSQGDDSFITYLDEHLQFLKSIGASNVAHSRENLLTHLIETSRILHKWGCNTSLVLAGLYHSVYGTESFERGIIILKDRNGVKKKIGTSAERLVYLFCVASRQSLYHNLTQPAENHFFISNHHNNKLIQLERSMFADLIVLDFANTVELTKRGVLSKKEMQKDWLLYSKAKEYLPETALAEMKRIYDF